MYYAIDVDTKEILALRVSYTRSSLDAELFLKRILQYCESKPLIIVDRGPWYVVDALSLSLEYEQITRGKSIE